MSDFRFLLKDVSISIVSQIEPVVNATYKDSFVQLNTEQFQIHIPEIANIGAYNGNSIQIEILGSMNQATIELYLNGSVLGAILLQRNQLAMHGSSVSYNGKGILFCGESGSGKSTLTFGLSRESDFEFLTDDITPIQTSDEVIEIEAISERLKLWTDSLNAFKVDSSELVPVRKDLDKFFFETKSADIRVPLRYLFFLEISDTSEITIEKMKGAEIIPALLDNVYRCEYLSGLKATELSYFEKHAQIASIVDCYKLSRPKDIDPKLVMNKICTII